MCLKTNICDILTVKVDSNYCVEEEEAMKFLLAAVNAKYIHSNPAVYSLRAYAGKDHRKHIAIAEYTINHKTEDILSDIYNRSPDVIAFSCYIWNIDIVLRIVPELHKIMPGIKIWLGGPEVSFDAERLLTDYPMLTGVMLGEGEETFAGLLAYYLNRLERDSARRDKAAAMRADGQSGLNKVEGIIYRSEDGIIKTGERKLTDIDALPFLYEDLDEFENRIIYYESGRGCPYSCSYCLSSIDKRVRLRNIRTVKKELQFFLDSRVEQVKFIDRTFNCNHEHTMEIWRYIHENDNGVTNFHFEIAADILREDELDLLSQMRPGLVQLEIGVQSANPVTLKEINRYTDMEKLKQAVSLIHQAKNIHMHLDLIAGLPYEDYESFGTSFDVVYGMRPHQLQLGFLKVLKGSPMYEKADSYGINYTSVPPYEVLYSKWLSYDNICRLKQIEEMVELYYNSSQFIHTLPVLEKAFESPFAMYGQLAEYYKEKGYFVNSPSRVYRYEALLAFACLKDAVHEELYKELLTYDIYLRENMKSRPDFAKDLSPYKERVKGFYMEEERLKELLPAYRDYQTRQIAKMTHMEVFTYCVWEDTAEGRMMKAAEETGVLFDYKNREPLTKAAGVHLMQFRNL